MKKIITSIAVATLIISLLPSCKKTDTQQPQTTQQKIQAKWQLQTLVENDHFSGADHIQNITGTANDYLDFRADGKVYTSISGSRDTVTYSLLNNDTQLLIDGSSRFDIKSLTSNSFIIYEKDIFGSDFLEETITMAK